MRRIVDDDYLTMLVRLAVGVAFIWASAYKIIEPGTFAKSIWYYHMVPGSLINLMALILPWLELIAGVCLIVGVLYRGSVIAVNGMTIVFILAISSAIYRGIDIDCGCFKAAQSSGDNAWESLLWDFLLIAGTIQLYFSRSTRWRLK